MRVLGRILDIDILRREGAVFVMEEAENTLAPPEGCDTGNDNGRDSIGMFRVDISVEVSGDCRPDVRVACERLSPLFETLSVFPAGNGFVVDEIVAIGDMGKDEGRFAGSRIKRLFQGGNGVEARERRYVLLANGFGADGHEEGFRGFVRLQEFAEVFFEDFGPFEIPFRVVVFVDRDVVVSENGQRGLWEESAEIGNAACNLFPEEVVGRKIASMDDAGNGDRQIVDCLDRLSEAPLVQRFSVMGIGNLHEPEIVCFCRESGKTDRRCDQAEEKENSVHICDDSKKRRQSGFVFFARGFVDKTDGKDKEVRDGCFFARMFRYDTIRLRNGLLPTDDRSGSGSGLPRAQPALGHARLRMFARFSGECRHCAGGASERKACYGVSARRGAGFSRHGRTG